MSSEQQQDFLEISRPVAGSESGFVQGQLKLSASRFLKRLALGLLENGEASLNE